MLQQQFPPDSDRQLDELPPTELTNDQEEDFEIYQELDRLEDIIVYSAVVPLTGKKLVDEQELFNQLDLIRRLLPDAIDNSREVLRQKEDILLQAQYYSSEIIQDAEQRAAEILDRMAIVQKAETEAAQIWQRVQQQCQQLQEKTMLEIEQMRSQAQQELEEIRQSTMAECQNLEHDADAYADRVLSSLEQQLGDMMKVVRNGRSQLNTDS